MEPTELSARIDALSGPEWESLVRAAARVDHRIVAAWQVAATRRGDVAVAPDPLQYRGLLTRQMVAFAGESVELLRTIEGTLR